MGRAKKAPPVSMPMAPAPAPPVAALPALKEAAPKDKAEFATSAGAEMAQIQSGARAFAPPAVSPGNAQQVQNLPVPARSAETTSDAIAAGNTAAPADARTLFNGALAAGGGGGRGGAVGGIASGAAGIRSLAKTAFVAPAAHLGVQYRILRKTDSGDFVETDAAATGSIGAGTPFKLQITANDSGYLRILQDAPDGAWREIVNHAVERMQPIETEPIQLDQPGRVKFYLVFSRQPLPPSNVAQPDDDIVVDRGRVVTVAGRAAAAQQLSFNITLTIQ
jgi:hypothetical protein